MLRLSATEKWATETETSDCTLSPHIRDQRSAFLSDCSIYPVRGDATRLRVEKADGREDENLICSVNRSNVTFHPLS